MTPEERARLVAAIRPMLPPPGDPDWRSDNSDLESSTDAELLAIATGLIDGMADGGFAELVRRLVHLPYSRAAAPRVEKGRQTHAAVLADRDAGLSIAQTAKKRDLDRRTVEKYRAKKPPA